MILLIGSFAAIVIFTLALLHIYWGAGGTWAFDSVLPHDTNNKEVLEPNWVDCFVIAVGLIAVAALFVANTGVINVSLPTWLRDYGMWVVAIIFTMRAIGDFKYIGFFKRIKGTIFSRLDTLCYSPLCLILAICAILVQVIKR